MKYVETSLRTSASRSTLSLSLSLFFISSQRIADVTSALQSRLEQLFQEALGRRDREGLTHCLQAYASICRQEDAETMFQAAVVHPFLDKVSLGGHSLQR